MKRVSPFSALRIPAVLQHIATILSIGATAILGPYGIHMFA